MSWPFRPSSWNYVERRVWIGHFRLVTPTRSFSGTAPSLGAPLSRVLVGLHSPQGLWEPALRIFPLLADHVLPCGEREAS